MAALAGQVGLQLLLTPSTSNFIFKGTSLVLGTAYPIYSSYALLESNASAQEKEKACTQWVTYWTIYGVISAAEQLFQTRPPLYYHVKLAFLLWLQESRYQGARRLYVLFLRPFLREHQPQIDALISFVSSVRAQPPVAYVGNLIHTLVGKVPYLNWFVQPFDEAIQKSWWAKK